MEIEYGSTKLMKICNDSRAATREVGRESAKKLRTRIADIEAASCVTELVAGRPEPLKGNWEGRFSVRLHGPHHLVFEPADEPIPFRDDGGIDWNRVTRIRVVGIGDYHG